MKKLLILLFILKAGFYGYAQNTWVRTFGGMEIDKGREAQQTQDNGFILVGYTRSFGHGNSDVYLIKTNDCGDTLWTKTYGDASFDLGYSVQQTLDGGYIITGQTSSGVLVIKTTNQGDTLWTKKYNFGNYLYGSSIKQLKNSNYVVCGVTDFYEGSYNGFIMKINSAGDTLWTQIKRENPIKSIEILQDGNMIFAGTETKTVYSKASLLKTDSLGNTIWFKNYRPLNWSSSGMCCRKTMDGGFILAGSSAVLENESFIYLVKTNSSGDTVWTRKIGPEGGFSDGNSVIETQDGGYVVVGRCKAIWGQGSYNIILVKTDSMGHVIWSNTFGDTLSDEAHSVNTISNNSGFIIAGEIGNDACLIKTDYDGNVTDVNYLNKPIPEKSKFFQNYPNPFNQRTVIEYEVSADNQLIEINIYNLVGEKVDTLIRSIHNTGTYSLIWDGKDEKGGDLPSGIYFCQLKQKGNNYIEAKKIVFIK